MVNAFDCHDRHYCFEYQEKSKLGRITGRCNNIYISSGICPGIDAGDAIQGEVIGSLTKGSAIIDLRTGNPVFDSYKIVELNGEKIALIGVSTPESYTKSTPAYFQDEEGNVIYGFSADTDDEFYKSVQTAVDAARKDGAERVIAIVRKILAAL